MDAPRRSAILALLCLSLATLPTSGDATTTSSDAPIAVIGGGIAGTVTCLNLLTRGYTNVTLYESSVDLRTSTSSVIAGTVNFETNLRFLPNSGFDLGDVLDFLGGDDGGGGLLDGGLDGTQRFVDFVRNVLQEEDGRRNDAIQRRRVYRRSYEKMLDMMAEFPRLCSAFLGEWCCRVGDEARGYVEDATGLNCPATTTEDGSVAADDAAAAAAAVPRPFGKFYLISDDCESIETGSNEPLSGCDDASYRDRESCEGAGFGYQDVSYAYYGLNETLDLVGDFVRSDTDNIRCSIVEHGLTGLARTEELFGILTELLSPSVTLRLGCQVTELSAESAAAAAVGTNRIAVTSTCDGSGSVTTETYDKVIVAASTASVPLLRSIDPNLETNLLGVKGYGMVGSEGDGTPMIGLDQRGRAVQFARATSERRAAYARATSPGGKVKIWGGLYPDPNDDDDGSVRPPYDMPSDDVKAELFADSPPAPEISRLLYESDSSKVDVGVRPVPSIGNVPLIKRYSGPYTNLFLNTGYGFNGYDLPWFASDCVVSWLDGGELTDPTCRTAAAVGAEKTDFPLWAIVLIAVVGSLVVLGCCCYCCKRRKRESD